MQAPAVALYAPTGYWEMTPEQKKEVCNGCGPFGKFDFIPDTITFGETLTAKEEADRVFLNNMLRIIEGDSSFFGKLLKPVRRRRALLYYEMVVSFGGPAFWAGKNPPENIRPAG